jgi:UDP-N-acetylmuramate dehydrogenase
MALQNGVKRLLTKGFKERIRFNVPMSAYTTLRVGGMADAMVWPENVSEIALLLDVLDSEKIDWFVYGGGSNLLVKDGGIRGVVIATHPGLAEIHELRAGPENMDILVESGVSLKNLCRFAAKRGLQGISFAAGIPGTVGGAVMMNAGIPTRDISSVVAAVEVVTPGNRFIIDRGKISFGYRSVLLPVNGRGKAGRPGIIVSCVIRLKKGDPAREKKEIETFIKRRRVMQPGGFSAGSFFKNPPPVRQQGS